MTLHTTIEGRVMILTMDRPKANAIDSGLSKALGNAFIRYRDDPSLRCAIVTAAGEKFFSAGWDLKAAAENKDEAEDYGPGGFAGITELFDLDKPVLAAVNGPAVGVGLSFALACDLVVAAESAYFLLAFVNIGLAPDGGSSYLLPERIGFTRAAEMALLGERIPAPKALEWGLVNRVVPDRDL
ncbi:MAG: enoyl-CoA hydratase-related protein, partial [Burkholderiales bacterium]